MKTAERIRSLREDKDLTQTDVADYLKTSQTVYSRYERNERSLPIEMLYELCDFYNVSADYILGRTDNPKTNKQAFWGNYYGNTYSQRQHFYT